MLLTIIKLQVSTAFQNAVCLTSCDSASSRSWISAKLVKSQCLSGRDYDLTVNIFTKQLLLERNKLR